MKCPKCEYDLIEEHWTKHDNITNLSTDYITYWCVMCSWTITEVAKDE